MFLERGFSRLMSAASCNWRLRLSLVAGFWVMMRLTMTIFVMSAPAAMSLGLIVSASPSSLASKRTSRGPSVFGLPSGHSRPVVVRAMMSSRTTLLPHPGWPPNIVMFPLGMRSCHSHSSFSVTMSDILMPTMETFSPTVSSLSVVWKRNSPFFGAAAFDSSFLRFASFASNSRLIFAVSVCWSQTESLKQIMVSHSGSVHL